MQKTGKKKEKSQTPKIIGNLSVYLDAVFPVGVIIPLIILLHAKTVANIIF